MHTPQFSTATERANTKAAAALALRFTTYTSDHPKEGRDDG